MRALNERLVDRGRVLDLLRRLYLWQVATEMIAEMMQFDDDDFPAGSLRRFCKSAGICVATEVHTELASEHARLFYANKRIPAPPYASVYLSGERLLMQEAAFGVRSEFNRFGFMRANEGKEPDDHIGVIFEFLFVLNQKLKTALKTSDQNTAKKLINTPFIEAFLASWVDRFCADIKGDSQNIFWQECAIFTANFVKEDLQFLKELQDRLD